MKEKSPMHELSLAMSVVEYLQNLAKDQGMKRIDAVFLEVGELTHVDPRQLRESFKIASQGTVAEGSKVYVKRRLVSLKCTKCGKENKIELKDTITDYSLKCSFCGSTDVEIDKGRELLLRRVKGSK
jgi:hydrogenase nickel incorporation protein HypA/HybF